MKKNKAFTLVELLVIISILSIILVLAIPNIMKMSNRMKERGLENKIDAIEKAAITYVQNHSRDIKDKYGVCNEANASQPWCKCFEKTTGDYSRKVCKYSLEMNIKGLIKEGAYASESKDENSSCNIPDPTNNEKCLDCAKITIELDGDYKTVTAHVDKDGISNDNTCAEKLLQIGSN